MKTNNSNIGFGIGVGSPYQVDIFGLCSPSNPLAAETYPCNVLNAGVIASVGIGCSGFLVIVGLLFLTVKQSKINTNNVFEDWTNRVTKLCTNVEKGCYSLAFSCVRWIFGIGSIFFVVLVITFTLRQRVDLIDGARIGGSFLFSLVLSLGCLTFSLIQIPKFINSVIETTQDKQSMRIGLSTAMLGSSGIAFVTVGIAFCGFCGTFLLMTIDRNDPLGNGVFAYGNRCRTTGNGAFCGQTLSLPATCGFCMGLSVVALMARSLTGILAKAAEIGDELVDKLESSTVDQLLNPAQCLDFVGNLAAEAVGTASSHLAPIVLLILSISQFLKVFPWLTLSRTPPSSSPPRIPPSASY
jgi:Na+/H+-translocating membrane pyrophosphatase